MSRGIKILVVGHSAASIGAIAGTMAETLITSVKHLEEFQKSMVEVAQVGITMESLIIDDFKQVDLPFIDPAEPSRTGWNKPYKFRAKTSNIRNKIQINNKNQLNYKFKKINHD